MQNLIVNSGIATVETTNKLYYNKVGAGYLGDEGDDIWISCEPTGNSGQTMVEQSSSSNDDIGNKFSIKNLFDSSAGLFLKGVITAGMLPINIIKFQWRRERDSNPRKELLPSQV